MNFFTNSGNLLSNHKLFYETIYRYKFNLDCKELELPDDLFPICPIVGKKDSFTNYWAKLVEHYDTLDSLSLDESLKNEKNKNEKDFQLLDEIEDLDFEKYKNLIDSTLIIQSLSEKYTGEKKEYLNCGLGMILASGSKKNIFQLMKDNTYSHLITVDNIKNFFRAIIFRHGNVVAHAVWKNFLSPRFLSPNNSILTPLLLIIMKAQPFNLKIRNKREIEALDQLCVQIFSQFIDPSQSLEYQVKCLIIKYAVFLGLEQSTKTLLDYFEVAPRDSFQAYILSGFIFEISWHLYKFKDERKILILFKNLFENQCLIQSNNLVWAINLLRVVFQIMSTRRLRELELQNKLEAISDELFKSIQNILESLTTDHLNNFFSYAPYFINITYDAMKRRSPYFFENSFCVVAKLHQRILSISEYNNFDPNIVNFTEIMTHRSFQQSFMRMAHMAGFEFYQNAFKISFWRNNSDLFGSNAIFAINNLYQNNPVPAGYYESVVKDSLTQRYDHQQNNKPNIACDEIFCMNLAFIVDNFFTTNEQKVSMLRDLSPTLKQFFVPRYKKGCSLWVWNHLIQRQDETRSKAIKCFQAVLDTQWLYDSPYHTVWALNPGSSENRQFIRAYDKYETIAIRLETLRPKSLYFSEKRGVVAFQTPSKNS